MMFRKVAIASFCLVLAFSLVGCAAKNGGNSDNGTTTGSEFQSDINAPDWFFEPPQKDGSIFAASSAKSSRMTVAIDKAQLQAKRELASTIRSTLEGQRERYIEEIGNTSNEQETAVREQYQDFTREMVAEELQGVRMAEKGIIEEDRGYRAYVLMELTMDNLRDQLSDKQELQTRFNAQQFEEDMDQNLEELRQQRQQ